MKIAILCGLSLLGLAACGVKGDPIPYVEAYPKVGPPVAPVPPPKEAPR